MVQAWFMCDCSINLSYCERDQRFEKYTISLLWYWVWKMHMVWFYSQWFLSCYMCNCYDGFYKNGKLWAVFQGQVQQRHQQEWSQVLSWHCEETCVSCLCRRVGLWSSRTWRWCHIQPCLAKHGNSSSCIFLNRYVSRYVHYSRLLYHLFPARYNEYLVRPLDRSMVRPGIDRRHETTGQGYEKMEQTIPYCIPSCYYSRPFRTPYPRFRRYRPHLEECSRTEHIRVQNWWSLCQC